jgi:hypothetical protein
MTATHPDRAPEGIAQDLEAPVADQATVGPLTGDPAIVGVPTFVIGSVMLGLALINYAPAAGGALPIIILATGIGQLVATLWAAALGQSAVAAIFGIFSGFWLSYAALLTGLAHGWWGVTPAAVVHTVTAFLISWPGRRKDARGLRRGQGSRQHGSIGLGQGIPGRWPGVGAANRFE